MQFGKKRLQLYCRDCDLRFSIQSQRRNRRHYFCPLCGESVGVTLHIVKRTVPLTRYKHWTEEEKQKLIHLYNTTNYTSRDMAYIIGRPVKGVQHKLNRLRRLGLIN